MNENGITESEVNLIFKYASEISYLIDDSGDYDNAALILRNRLYWINIYLSKPNATSESVSEGSASRSNQELEEEHDITSDEVETDYYALMYLASSSNQVLHTDENDESNDILDDESYD